MIPQGLFRDSRILRLGSYQVHVPIFSRGGNGRPIEVLPPFSWTELCPQHACAEVLTPGIRLYFRIRFLK